MDKLKIERAIRGLSEWQKHVQPDSDIDRDISTALEALKGMLPTSMSVTSDAISRQVAKEAYCKNFCHRGVACPDTLCKEVNEAFDGIPSAQPDAPDINVGGINTSLKAEGRDEFRQTLVKIYDMPPSDRVKVFGTGTVGDIVRNTDFIAMREKLEEYENTPKVGEVWERSAKVVVRGVREKAILVYEVSTGKSDFWDRNYFVENYHNTGKVCKTLMPFLEELEKLKNESE